MTFHHYNRYNIDECQIHNLDECSHRYNTEDCQRYNLDENLDNLPTRRHDSVSSRDASTSTHDTDSMNNMLSQTVVARGSYSQRMVARGTIVPGMVDKNTISPAMVGREAIPPARVARETTPLATPSCSYHKTSTKTNHGMKPTGLTAADLVNGLVDTNGDLMYIDADSNEYIENSIKANDNEPLYFESTV